MSSVLGSPFGQAREPDGSSADLSAFDRTMEEFMRLRSIPGASLGVLKTWKDEVGGRVYLKGYGHADEAGRIPVTSRSLFRIASVSKPITGIAILKLVDQGNLNLDDRLLDHLDLEPLPSAEGRPDPRWSQITLRQLLQHTGGWDRDAAFDPMFRSGEISAAAGIRGPADASTICRFMRGLPLDFDPGSRYAYSNFGYCLLGRVIERVTGESYEAWIQSQVLHPHGITGMRLGRTLLEDRATDEVRYHVSPGQKRQSVFPDHPGKIAWPYGGFCLEAMDAHGGWLASAEDLIRFVALLAQPERSRLLSPEALSQLDAPPAPPVSRDDAGRLKDRFYGLGWMVRPKGKNGANHWHGGSLPGTHTLLVRRWDGFAWVALFNRRNGSPDHPDSEIDPALHRAANAAAGWDTPLPLPFAE